MGKHFAVLFLFLVSAEYIKIDYGKKNNKTYGVGVYFCAKSLYS